VKVLKRYFVLIWMLILSASHISAQVNARASIKIDTNAIRIGEQTRLEIIFGYNKSATTKKLVWPEISDTIRKEIEVIGRSKIEPFNTKSGGSTSEYRQTITITSFDSGFWVIPPFKFLLDGDSVPIAETEALILEVKTVQTDTAETSVRDIKPIFEEKFDWREILPYIYWTLATLAILGVIIWITIYVNNKKKNKPVFKVSKPTEPPHITALRQLELIQQQKIWTEGKYKEYYTSITDALRSYIEGRFKINAMELTTEEILQIFRTQVIDTESKNKLKQILELSDFVKFAKATPIDVENEFILQNAFDFVNGTKREELQQVPDNQTGEKQ
jgi:hypothetical protein